MIVKLNISDKSEVQNVLNLQLLAYKVEADLIEFDQIPQLNDTANLIMASKETFIGYKYGEELTGFISCEILDEELDICRLVVHPNCFRKGVASKLLEYVLHENPEINRYTVSTGSRNIPAIRLYEQFGFTSYQEIEVATGIYITLLEKVT